MADGFGDLDAYMSQAQFGDPNVGFEPGSMVEQGVMDFQQQGGGAGSMGAAHDQGDYQVPVIDYVKGQYGINLPTTEARLPLSGAGSEAGMAGKGQQTNMQPFRTSEERNIQIQASRSRPTKDAHPISIITPTPSGVHAAKQRIRTPANTYSGTILDGLGSKEATARRDKLSKAQEFAAMAAKDKQMRDAVRARAIEENADGHYTKQKLAQQAVDRSYRGIPEPEGDRFDSYVDQLGDGPSSSIGTGMSKAEIRMKAKRDKQEEYALLLQEQQELKKLYDIRAQEKLENENPQFTPNAPEGSPTGSIRSPARFPSRGGGGGGVSTIGAQSPVAPTNMNAAQKARYRAQQLQYRQELDSQIEKKKTIGMHSEREGGRLSADADVRREREKENARLHALREIPTAEINEFERKRMQSQKLLIQSLENTNASLDNQLLGAWNKHARDEATVRESEGDYFQGVGSYQSQLGDKERRKEEADRYQQQLAEDRAKNTITLPRRSLMDRKRDPYAPNRDQDGNVSVFQASQGSTQALPQVGRGAVGSISSGAIGMAPGDFAILKANKQSSQQAYAAMLQEDSNYVPQMSARKSLAAEHRAQRMQEDAPWIEEMTHEEKIAGRGQADRREKQDLTHANKRQMQAQWASELAQDQAMRDAERSRPGNHELYLSPRSSRGGDNSNSDHNKYTSGGNQITTDGSKFWRNDFPSPTKSHSHATYHSELLGRADTGTAAGAGVARDTEAGAHWNEATTTNPNRYYNDTHAAEHESHSHRTYREAGRDNSGDNRGEPPSVERGAGAGTGIGGQGVGGNDLTSASLDMDSLAEEDREALEAYEEYVRKMAREEALTRLRIQRGGNKDELADALYNDPFAQR